MHWLRALLARLRGPARPAAPVPPPQSGIDWAEVRRVYEAGVVPVSAILRRFGLTAYRLHKVATDGGWRKRQQVAEPGPNQGRRPVSPKLVAERLYSALDARVARLEGDPPAADDDELKKVAELARALRRILREDRLRNPAGPRERTSPERPAAGGGPQQKAYDPAHVEWMRAEFKRRISILRRSIGLDGEGGAGSAGGA